MICRGSYDQIRAHTHSVSNVEHVSSVSVYTLDFADADTLGCQLHSEITPSLPPSRVVSAEFLSPSPAAVSANKVSLNQGSEDPQNLEAVFVLSSSFDDGGGMFAGAAVHIRIPVPTPSNTSHTVYPLQCSDEIARDVGAIQV